MTELTCAWVRDRLPDRLDGRLDAASESRLSDHLERCEDCRFEMQLLEQLRTPVPVPPGLEVRVLRAVRREAGLAGPVRARRFPTTRHFAMAATVVFALVSASLLVRRDSGPEPLNLVFTDTPEGAGMVWSAWEDPLLEAGAGLHSLSVDELELVLKELER